MLAFIRTVIVIFALSVGTAQAQSQGPREWVSGVESIPIYRQTDATNEALYISSEWANADLDGKTRKDVTCLAVVYAMLQHAQGNLAYRIGQDGTWSDSLGALDKHGVQGERDLAPELATVQSEIRAGRPLILQGFSRQLGTNHFMLAVGLTSDQEIIAYDPLSGGEVLIPSDTMVAEIAQPGGSVLAFTVMTLRTLNVTLAAEDRPAPVATPEAAAGDGDANLLFAEAYRLYARALTLPEADQAEAMAEVRALLKRIADEHPTSRIGARIASGEPLGRMDRDRVFATTEPAREGAVSAELAAPTRTEDQGDPEVMRDWLHRNFPDLLDALDITMDESLGDFEAEVTIRAAYLIIMSANHAHNTLGWFEDPRDVAELYRSYVTSGGLSAATTLGKQVGKDMALAIVKDVVASFLTDLTMNALPDFNPGLETLVRAGVKATFLETASAVEAYKNPEKVIWLVLDRAHDMVEIARASKGLADLQDENLLTTALSLQTAAIMLHVHGDDPQARDQAARTITYLDTFMENMVGKDDAREVKDIFLLGFSALRHLYNGDTAMAEALRSDIIARGDAGNWPSLGIADTFTYLANLGQDAPKRAATIMINATDLAGMDGEGLGAARTNAATTGPGLPALPADAAAAPRAPLGSERQDTRPPGPAEASSAWAMGGEGAHLAPGETGLGVDHRADNSIWAFGRQALPPLNQGQGASAYASPSPDDSYRVITQTVDDRQVGWISRLALVPRDPSRPVLSMAPEDVFRFSGQVAWNADGRFAVLEYNHGEFESYALLVDLTTGSVSPIRPDRPASFVSSAVVSSVRSLGGGAHAIDFAHLACPEADPGCGMATIEDAGTTEVTFRLPGQAERQPVAVAPMQTATGQLGLFNALPDGLYAGDPDICAHQAENVVETLDRNFRLLERPQVGMFGQICNIVGARDAGNVAEVTLVCNAEGMYVERVERWQITSAASFTQFDAYGTPREYRLCAPSQPQGATPARPAAGEWTAAIVHPRGYGPGDLTKCMWDANSSLAGIECLRRDGASDETLRFARARASEGGDGPMVPVRFKELGKVDIAFLDIFSMNENEWEYFVNTSPESITYPMYPERELSTLASRGNGQARSILNRFPGAMAWKPFVAGMRILPNGYQRFSTLVYWTEGCRACPVVGYNVATVDYDQTGRLRAFETRGIFDNRSHGGFMSMTAVDLLRNSAAIQFYLNIRGYDAGEMDGVLGPRTRAALAEFQRENGVNAGTGQPDAATLAALADNNTLFANGVSRTGGGAGASPSPSSPVAALERYREEFRSQCAEPGIARSGLACPYVVAEFCEEEGCVNRGPVRAADTMELLAAPGSTRVVARLRKDEWAFQEYAEAWLAPCTSRTGGGQILWRLHSLGEGISNFWDGTRLLQMEDFRGITNAATPVAGDPSDPCLPENRHNWRLLKTEAGTYGWVKDPGGALGLLGSNHYSGDDMSGAPSWVRARELAPAMNQAQAYATIQAAAGMARQAPVPSDFAVIEGGNRVDFVFPWAVLERIASLSNDGDLASTGFDAAISETLSVSCVHWVTQGASPGNSGLLSVAQLLPALQCNLWQKTAGGGMSLVPNAPVSMARDERSGALVMSLGARELYQGARRTTAAPCRLSVWNSHLDFRLQRDVACAP